jgi:hypothetical protein
MRRAFGLLLLAAAMAGCVQAPEVRYPNPLALSDADAATAEGVARRVLTDMRFQIELPSSRPGIITTLPLTGDNWFEFWRDDTVGTSQRVDASLHTIRRSVTVTVASRDAGSEITVRVLKQRASAPNQAPENISRSIDLYNSRESELVQQDDLGQPLVVYQWINMGRDEALEQLLLERIESALASGGRP